MDDAGDRVDRRSTRLVYFHTRPERLAHTGLCFHPQHLFRSLMQPRRPLENATLPPVRGRLAGRRERAIPQYRYMAYPALAEATKGQDQFAAWRTQLIRARDIAAISKRAIVVSIA